MIPSKGFKFSPGSIVSISKDSYTCEIGGDNALGFAYNYLDTTNGYNYKDFLIVWCDRLVFRTDVYDKNAVCPYITGADLYINDNSILTTDKKILDQTLVGKIITGPSEKRVWLEAIWF